MPTTRQRLVGLAGSALILVAACGGNASPSPSAAVSAVASGAAIAVPEGYKAKGEINWCSDMTYPPEEFLAADGSTPQGSDIDIANEISKRLGLKARLTNTAGDLIIPALLAKKCDTIITGLNDLPERRLKMDYVDYLKAGQGLLVLAGNPKGIRTLEDLSGKSVAVQHTTTNEAALIAENDKLKAAGKPLIDIQAFQKDSDGFQQLAIGRVDAYSTDSPVVAYYNTLPANVGKFEIGGTPIEPVLVGIGINKDNNGLRDAIQTAMDAMYADGTMKSIIAKWGMTNAVELLK